MNNCGMIKLFINYVWRWKVKILTLPFLFLLKSFKEYKGYF